MLYVVEVRIKGLYFSDGVINIASDGTFKGYLTCDYISGRYDNEKKVLEANLKENTYICQNMSEPTTFRSKKIYFECPGEFILYKEKSPMKLNMTFLKKPENLSLKDFEKNLSQVLEFI